MGRIALILAAAWGLGRIAVGMHYPTDILAGAALGAIVTMLLRTNVPRVAINWLADSLGRIIPIGNSRFLSRNRHQPTVQHSLYLVLHLVNADDQAPIHTDRHGRSEGFA